MSTERIRYRFGSTARTQPSVTYLALRSVLELFCTRRGARPALRARSSLRTLPEAGVDRVYVVGVEVRERPSEQLLKPAG